ncbi:MAG TPA: hypothetical protein VMV77_07165 [Bacteroidales bacterium]|nr:hypothetical protein [Bacteroidales bacterium]
MNNGPFKKAIVITATSAEEFEGLSRYKSAKKNDKRSFKFIFNISKDNKVNVEITDYLK